MISTENTLIKKSTDDVLIMKKFGLWKPSIYLSNLALAYYEEDYKSRRAFPVLPVNSPAGKIFEFGKEDLARNNVQKKPPYGSVSPALFGLREKTYTCEVFQIMVGMDRIMELPYERAQSAFTLERARTRTIVEQINLKQEIDFAAKFFNASAWVNTWQGATTENVANKKFVKFSDTKSDPVKLFDMLSMEIRREGRRKPNRLALGVEAFIALKNNPNVQERIKYSGSSINPAVANEETLAQLFGLAQVIVLDSTANRAKVGAEDMQFICDSKGALLYYAPETAAVDEPSALYGFHWLISGDDYITITKQDGAAGSHTDFLEGLIAYDLVKTSDALAAYLTDVC